MFQTHKFDEFSILNSVEDTDVRSWSFLRQVNPTIWFHGSFIDESTQKPVVIMSLSLERVLREIESIKNFEIQVVFPPSEGWSGTWKMLLILDIYRAFTNVENDHKDYIGFILLTECGGEFLLRSRACETEIGIGEKLVSYELIYERKG